MNVQFSARQLDILRLGLLGIRTTAEQSKRLNMKQSTLIGHRSALFQKLLVGTWAEIEAKFVREGDLLLDQLADDVLRFVANYWRSSGGAYATLQNVITVFGLTRKHAQEILDMWDERCFIEPIASPSGIHYRPLAVP